MKLRLSVAALLLPQIVGILVLCSTADAQAWNESPKAEAFLCNEKLQPGQYAAPLTRGDEVRICMQPDVNTRKRGIAMRSINRFTLSKGEKGRDGIQQVIQARLPVYESITTLDCKPGDTICSFKTKLDADFFDPAWGENGSLLPPSTTSLRGTGAVAMEYVNMNGERMLLRGVVELKKTNDRLLQSSGTLAGTATVDVFDIPIKEGERNALSLTSEVKDDSSKFKDEFKNMPTWGKTLVVIALITCIFCCGCCVGVFCWFTKDRFLAEPTQRKFIKDPKKRISGTTKAMSGRSEITEIHVRDESSYMDKTQELCCSDRRGLLSRQLSSSSLQSFSSQESMTSHTDRTDISRARGAISAEPNNSQQRCDRSLSRQSYHGSTRHHPSVGRSPFDSCTKHRVNQTIPERHGCPHVRLPMRKEEKRIDPLSRQSYHGSTQHTPFRREGPKKHHTRNFIHKSDSYKQSLGKKYHPKAKSKDVENLGEPNGLPHFPEKQLSRKETLGYAANKLSTSSQQGCKKNFPANQISTVKPNEKSPKEHPPKKHLPTNKAECASNELSTSSQHSHKKDFLSNQISTIEPNKKFPQKHTPKKHLPTNKTEYASNELSTSSQHSHKKDFLSNQISTIEPKNKKFPKKHPPKKHLSTSKAECASNESSTPSQHSHKKNFLSKQIATTEPDKKFPKKHLPKKHLPMCKDDSDKKNDDNKLISDVPGGNCIDSQAPLSKPGKKKKKSKKGQSAQ